MHETVLVHTYCINGVVNYEQATYVSGSTFGEFDIRILSFCP